MYLQPPEIARFYGVWFPLLHYVNQHLKLVPHFPSEWQNAGVDTQVAIQVRNALWENDALRESFIAENPAQLTDQDLALAKSWQSRVQGNFFMFRHLKKYTVFLSEKSPARAYGVLGITDSLEEIMGPYLPIYVQAVLLPFEDRIIYDSLLSSYPIYFGSGIRNSLNTTYRNIQEQSGITVSLAQTDHGQDEFRQQVRERNQKVLKAFQKDLGKGGLSPKKMEEHVQNIAEFAQDHLLTLDTPSSLLEMALDDLETFFTTKAKPNRVSFKRFIRFLQDTERMEWDEADKFLDFIKGD